MSKPSGLKSPSKVLKPVLHSHEKQATANDFKNDTITIKENWNIGDKVLVSGSKPGCVQFLGETQFASGQWAGVALDDPLGKNDGSIAGVRYFQCKPLHGVFARPTKLIRHEAIAVESLGSFHSDKTSTNKLSTTKTNNAYSKTSKSVALTVANVKAAGKNTAEQSKPSGIRSPASSIRSLKLGGTPQTTNRPKSSTFNDIKIGDKVAVGKKLGFVRFIGETEFAKGFWVGIELDQPLGKNDGAVGEKRYFTCTMKHGLFSLSHKVEKVSTNTSHKELTDAPRLKSPGSSVSCLSSVSTTSKPSVNKKFSSEVSSRYKHKTATVGVHALKEALQEKQQHVEALLAERDLERSEMIEANITVAQKQAQIVQLKDLHETYMQDKEKELDALRAFVEQADIEKVSLFQELEDEKRKVEDLQFQLEEGKIFQDDMKNEFTFIKEKAKDLENSLNIEKQKSSSLQTSLEEARASKVSDKSDLLALQQESEIDKGKIADLTSQLLSIQAMVPASNSTTETIESQTLQLDDVVSQLNSIKEEKCFCEKKITILNEEICDLKVKLNAVIDEKKHIELNYLKQIESLTNQLQDANRLNTDQYVNNEKINEELTKHENESSERETIKDSSYQDEIIALNKQIKSLHKKYDEASQSNAEQQILLLEAESKKTDLEKQLISIKEEAANKQQLLLESLETIKKLEEKNKELEHDKDSTLLIYNKLQLDFNNIKCENNDLLIKLQQSEDVHVKLEKEINSMKLLLVDGKEYKSMEEKYQQQQFAVNNLQEQLQNSVSQLEIANKNCKKLESIIEKLNAENMTLDRLVSEKIEEIKNFNCDLDALKKSLHEFTQREIELKTSLKNTELNVKALTNENKTLQFDLSAITSLRDNLALNLQESDDHMEKLLSNLDKAEVINETLSQKLKKVEEDNFACHEKLDLQEKTFNEEMTKLLQANELLDKKSADHAEATKQMKVEYQSLHNKQSNVAIQLEKLQKEHNQLLSDLSDSQSKNSDLSQQLVIATEEKLKLSKQLEITSLSHGKVNTEISSLSSSVAELNITNDKLDKANKQLINQLESANSKLEVAYSKLNQRDTDLTVLKNENVILNDKLCSSERSCIQLHQEKIELQSIAAHITEKYETISKELVGKKMELEEVQALKTQLQLKIEALIKQSEQTSDSYTSNTNMLKQECINLQKHLNEVNGNNLLLQNQLDEEKKKIDSGQIECTFLQDQLLQSKHQINLYEDQIATLSQSMVTVENEVENLKEQNNAIQVELDAVKESYALKQQENLKLNAKYHQVYANTDVLSSDIITKDEIISSLQKQLLEDKAKLTLQLDKMKEHINQNLSHEVKKLTEDLDTKNLHITDLKNENFQLTQERDNILLKFQQLHKSKSNLEDREKVLKNEFSIERDSLQKSLDIATALVETKNKEILECRDEMEYLKKTQLVLENVQSHVSVLEEKFNIKAQTSKSINNERNSNEVDFLNKVIVDQQSKIESLLVKIKELENIMINVEDDGATEITHQIYAPRLFCDICDIFDAHDTEDCPTQSMTNPEQDHGPHCRYKKGEVRPYCENCEEFGHWTADCQADEMY